MFIQGNKWCYSMYTSCRHNTSYCFGNMSKPDKITACYRLQFSSTKVLYLNKASSSINAAYQVHHSLLLLVRPQSVVTILGEVHIWIQSTRRCQRLQSHTQSQQSSLITLCQFDTSCMFLMCFFSVVHLHADVKWCELLNSSPPFSSASKTGSFAWLWKHIYASNKTM